MGKPKKKPEEPPAGLPPWMATFSDLVTLLLTFFVMLTAMASFEDNEKVESVTESLWRTFGRKGYGEARLSTDEGDFKSQSIRRQDVQHPLEAVVKKLAQDAIVIDRVRVKADEQELRLRLDDRVFFGPNSAEVQADAVPVLARVGRLLAEHDVAVRVEGHTDATGTEAANWELSSLRSIAVADVLRTAGGVDGAYLRPVAKAHFTPVALHEDDQAWNRRIEIIVKGDDLAAATAAFDLEAADGGR